MSTVRWLHKECRDRDLCTFLRDKQRPKCPDCKRRMMVRRSKSLDVFWSCRAWPECVGRKSIDQQKFAAFLAARDSSASAPTG